MTLNQLQTYIIGVLQGYFPNKTVLDKFTETADGKVLFNGMEIGTGSGFVTDLQVSQAIADTLAQLGGDVSAPIVLSVNINEETGNVVVDGLMFTCNVGTEIKDIVLTMDEPLFVADNADMVVNQVVKDSTDTVLPAETIGATYGVFSVDGATITITPNQENALTRYAGSVSFTIPAGIILDKLGNSRAYTFTLTIVDPLAATYQTLGTNSIVKAPLSDSAVYDEYEIALEALNANTTNDVVVAIKNLAPHANGSGEEGIWAGFSIIAPENAKGRKSSFSSKPVNALNIINGAPKTIEENVDGLGNKGVAFYVDWSKYNLANIVVQFYEDAECTKPLTGIYKFRMVASPDSGPFTT